MIEQFGFTSLREVIAALFLLSGLVFFVGSAIGMLRLPDFYSRIHASGNSETLGCTLSFIGLMIYEGPTLTAAKMAFVFLLVFMANPIGSHILSQPINPDILSGHCKARAPKSLSVWKKQTTALTSLLVISVRRL